MALSIFINQQANGRIYKKKNIVLLTDIPMQITIRSDVQHSFSDASIDARFHFRNINAAKHIVCTFS